MIAYELIITIDGEPVRGLESYGSRDLDGAVDKAEDLSEQHPEMKVGIDLAKTDGQDYTTIASFCLEEGHDWTYVWNDIAREMDSYRLYTIEDKIGCAVRGAECAYETGREAIDHAKKLIFTDGAHGCTWLTVTERGLLEKEDTFVYAIVAIPEEAEYSGHEVTDVMQECEDVLERIVHDDEWEDIGEDTMDSVIDRAMAKTCLEVTDKDVVDVDHEDNIPYSESSVRDVMRDVLKVLVAEHKADAAYGDPYEPGAFWLCNAAGERAKVVFPRSCEDTWGYLMEHFPTAWSLIEDLTPVYRGEGIPEISTDEELQRFFDDAYPEQRDEE